eukprot:scaffold285_cov330-Pavlova_lutheri.AAC.39
MGPTRRNNSRTKNPKHTAAATSSWSTSSQGHISCTFSFFSTRCCRIISPVSTIGTSFSLARAITSFILAVASSHTAIVGISSRLRPVPSGNLDPSCLFGDLYPPKPVPRSPPGSPSTRDPRVQSIPIPRSNGSRERIDLRFNPRVKEVHKGEEGTKTSRRG